MKANSKQKIGLIFFIFEDPFNDEWAWTACAMNMGLTVYDTTKSKAEKRLKRLVKEHINFAVAHGIISLLDAPLKNDYIWKLFDSLQGAASNEGAFRLSIENEDKNESSARRPASLQWSINDEHGRYDAAA